MQFLDKPPREETPHPLLAPSIRPTKSDEHAQPYKITARHKPNSQHLEITIPVEPNQSRWNQDKAQELGAGITEEISGADGKGKAKARRKAKEEVKVAPAVKPLDRITYQSHAVPDATNYLVGVLENGNIALISLDCVKRANQFQELTDQLHLNPVTQTYQLRAALTYLDTLLADARKQKSKNAKEAAGDDEDEDEDVDPADDTGKKLKADTAKAVQVSIKQSADLSVGFTGKGGGNGRADASLFDPLRAKEGEAWINLTHYNADVRLFDPFYPLHVN